MTDDKKHDDKDRKKLSDEEMEDVAGGAVAAEAIVSGGLEGIRKDKRSKMRKNDTSLTGDMNHSS